MNEALIAAMPARSASRRGLLGWLAALPALWPRTGAAKRRNRAKRGRRDGKPMIRDQLRGRPARRRNVAICHRTGTGVVRRLSIRATAAPAHLAHGDFYRGDCCADGECASGLVCAWGACAIPG